MADSGDLRLTAVPEVQVEMLIRRPAKEVFQAFVDPDVTTKFWFTKSSGELAPGATVTWEWEMYGVSTVVTVREVEENRRLLVEWNPESPTTVEWQFIPGEQDSTFVRIIESGLSGDGDEVTAHAIDSTKGFTFVLAGLKALLEHDVRLNLVADYNPPGFNDEH